MIAGMLPRVLRITPDDRLERLRAGDDARAPLWVVAPAEAVLLTEVERLPGPASRLPRVVPWQVEDRLAVPVETQHVAFAPLGPDRLAVAVVDRERMRRWLSLLREAGHDAAVLVPEPLLLPWDGSRAAVADAGDGRRVARLGPCSGFCGAPAEVQAVLGGREAVELGGLPLPASVQLPAPALNLLQGEFMPAHLQAGPGRAWGRVAAAGVLLGGLVAGHLALEARGLSGQVQAQRTEMAELYRQLQPGDGPVASPEAFLASALRSAGQARAPVFDHLQALGLALRAEACCELQALDYRGDVLEAVVVAPDVAALDGLRGRVVAAGGPADLAAATPGSRGVEGRLRIGGGAR